MGREAGGPEARELQQLLLLRTPTQECPTQGLPVSPSSPLLLSASGPLISSGCIISGQGWVLPLSQGPGLQTCQNDRTCP